MSPSVEPFNEAKYKALMDGLSIKEESLNKVLSSNGYFRLEAEYFVAQSFSSSNSLFGRDVLDYIQYGTSKYLNEQNEGFPVLRLNEYDSFFIKKPAKCCDKISLQEYEDLRLKKNDVLICRTNGNPDLVGRAAIVMKDYPYAYASYLFRVRTNDKIKPSTFVAYLNSKYGRMEIDKNSMKGNQTNFSPAKLNDIVVPLFSLGFESCIQDYFQLAYEDVEASKAKYQSAADLLSNYLNLSQFDGNNCIVKQISDSFQKSGRLDAEYYQSKYEIVENHILTMAHCMLSDVADVISGEFVEDSEYGAVGIAYIRGSDITNSVIDNDNAVKVNVSLDKRKTISTNDIAFSMIGSVGNVSINKSCDMGLVSNNLGVIAPHDKKMSNLFLLYLSSEIGQLLFEKYQTRTAQPKIKKEDVGKFLFPILPIEKQMKLSQMVEDSFAFRHRSQQLLDIAVKAVEMAIETDESTALAWLKTQQIGE